MGNDTFVGTADGHGVFVILGGCAYLLSFFMIYTLYSVYANKKGKSAEILILLLSISSIILSGSIMVESLMMLSGSGISCRLSALFKISCLVIQSVSVFLLAISANLSTVHNHTLSIFDTVTSSFFITSVLLAIAFVFNGKSEVNSYCFYKITSHIIIYLFIPIFMVVALSMIYFYRSIYSMSTAVRRTSITHVRRLPTIIVTSETGEVEVKRDNITEVNNISSAIPFKLMKYKFISLVLGYIVFNLFIIIETDYILFNLSLVLNVVSIYILYFYTNPKLTQYLICQKPKVAPTIFVSSARSNPPIFSPHQSDTKTLPSP